MSSKFSDSDYQLARLIAGDFKKNRVFRFIDVEDIAEKLATHLFLSMAKFDPAKWEWDRFARTVMRQKGRALIRKQNTVNAVGMREKTSSIDVVVGVDECGDPEYLADITPDNCPPMAAEVDFRIDCDAAFATLTDEQREVAWHLANGTKEQIEMAEEMGIPVSTFRDRCVRPVQKVVRAVCQK